MSTIPEVEPGCCCCFWKKNEENKSINPSKMTPPGYSGTSVIQIATQPSDQRPSPNVMNASQCKDHSSLLDTSYDDRGV
jgi:hypothetical protein